MVMFPYQIIKFGSFFITVNLAKIFPIGSQVIKDSLTQMVVVTAMPWSWTDNFTVATKITEYQI